MRGPTGSSAPLRTQYSAPRRASSVVAEMLATKSRVARSTCAVISAPPPWNSTNRASTAGTGVAGSTSEATGSLCGPRSSPMRSVRRTPRPRRARRRPVCARSHRRHRGRRGMRAARAVGVSSGDANAGGMPAAGGGAGTGGAVSGQRGHAGAAAARGQPLRVPMEPLRQRAAGATASGRLERRCARRALAGGADTFVDERRRGLGSRRGGSGAVRPHRRGERKVAGVASTGRSMAQSDSSRVSATSGWSAVRARPVRGAPSTSLPSSDGSNGAVRDPWISSKPGGGFSDTVDHRLTETRS